MIGRDDWWGLSISNQSGKSLFSKRKQQQSLLLESNDACAFLASAPNHVVLLDMQMRSFGTLALPSCVSCVTGGRMWLAPMQDYSMQPLALFQCLVLWLRYFFFIFWKKIQCLVCPCPLPSLWPQPCSARLVAMWTRNHPGLPVM